MVENRIKPRQDVQLDASIVDMAGALVGRCKLVDMSESGAKLIQLGSTDAPNKFNLVLTRDGKIRRRCEVAWRSERDLGVRFVKSESIEGRTKHNKIDA
jgi:hypothetical protein